MTRCNKSEEEPKIPGMVLPGHQLRPPKRPREADVGMALVGTGQIRGKAVYVQ